MSPKRNPLGRLLRLREIRERTARIEMAHAQREELEAEAAAAVARAAEDDHILPSDVLRPGQLRALSLMGTRLNEIRQAAEAEHEASQRRLEQRRHSWRHTSTELDSAEKLLDRQHQAAAFAARAAAERALDDLQIIRRGKEQR